MWKRIFLPAALASLSLGHESLLAQDAGESPAAQTPAVNLWSQVNWLRLEISGGRIALTSRRCGQTRVGVEPADGNPQRQLLTVDAQPAVVLATYESADERETITLSIDARQQVTIARRPQGAGAVELRYIQPATGPIQLCLGTDDPRKYTAASLWHLLVAEPAAREQLMPVLAKIRPTWGLAEQLQAVEQSLVAVAGADVSMQRRQWRAWVDQLTDPSFARRAQADQALRATGQAALVHLRQLDPAEIDREQRQRIRGILAAIADSGPDSPERVAAWLADDKRVWLALLARPDQATSLAAAGHLSLLSGKPIAIDPAASDERRAQQLLELKALLAEQR